MTLILIVLMGCPDGTTNPITEIGNPERVVGAVVGSSLPAWIDTAPGAVQLVEHAWIGLTEVAYLDEDCVVGAVASSGSAVVDLADPSTTLTLVTGSPDDCGAKLGINPVLELPDGAPEVLRGASVVLEGRDALDRPFLLRSTAGHSVIMERVGDIREPVFGEGAIIVADLLMWTAGIDIASFPADDDGVVRIEASSEFDANIPGAFRITYDYDGDGVLESWEIDGGTALAAPPLEDEDDDSLPDINEQRIHATDPRDTDTDDDNLGDGSEVLQHRTDPTRVDSDEDGVEDGAEVLAGSDPLDPDSP